MSGSKLSRRSLFAGAAASLLAPHAVAAQVASDGEMGFLLPGGSVSIDDVRLDLWAPGGGFYTAMLSFVPTQDEINRFLSTGSHVDFFFDFIGVQPAEQDANFVAPAVSDHVRSPGADVFHGENTTYMARCLNIELRWVAGKRIVVMAPISGYHSNGVAPMMSVQMATAKYWHVDGGDFVYERTTDDVTKRYAREETGERSQLTYKQEFTRFMF